MLVRTAGSLQRHTNTPVSLNPAALLEAPGIQTQAEGIAPGYSLCLHLQWVQVHNVRCKGVERLFCLKGGIEPPPPGFHYAPPRGPCFAQAEGRPRGGESLKSKPRDAAQGHAGVAVECKVLWNAKRAWRSPFRLQGGVEPLPRQGPLDLKSRPKGPPSVHAGWVVASKAACVLGGDRGRLNKLGTNLRSPDGSTNAKAHSLHLPNTIHPFMVMTMATQISHAVNICKVKSKAQGQQRSPEGDMWRRSLLRASLEP